MLMLDEDRRAFVAALLPVTPEEEQQQRHAEQRARELARARLPLILDDVPRRGARKPKPGEDDRPEKTAQEMRAENDQRQIAARRRRKQGHLDLLNVNGTPEVDPPADAQKTAAQVTAAKSPKATKPGPVQLHARERSPLATQDALTRRVVGVAPAYQQLVKLAMAADVHRGRFVLTYCRLLRENGREGRGVGKEQLAALAAGEPWVRAVDYGYRTLRWAYNLFAGWMLEQYQAGHIFTEVELAPMRVWVEAMNQGGYQPDEVEICEHVVDNPVAEGDA